MPRTQPRKVPDKADFYMGMAFMIASRSKDPKTQCGAVIVSADNEPLGSGFNGPPRRINDNQVDWSRPAKYGKIRHAERNAISHSDKRLLPGSTLYITDKPCPPCMLEIAEHELAKVVYFPLQRDDKSMLSHQNMDETDEIADMWKVQLIEYSGNLNWMRDRILWMKQMGVFG